MILFLENMIMSSFRVLKRRSWALGVLATLALSSPALAEGFKEGDRALQVSGGFVHAQGSDVGTLNADVGLGFFTTPNVELGFLQGLAYSFVDGSEDFWRASTIMFANYNFAQQGSNFVPFAGAFGGALWNDDDISGTIGPNLGVKVLLGEDQSTFLVTRYRYEWAINELDVGGVTDDSSDGNHVITIGLGYRF